MPILILIIKIVTLLYVTGYGLTSLLLPKNIKNDFIWIVPWMGTILIALSGITLSLAKIPMQYAGIIILGLSLILTIASFFKKESVTFSINREHLFICLLVILGMVFNLFVLWKRAGFPTTLALQNTDPINYTYTADFLVSHTLYDGGTYEPFRNYLAATGNLIHSTYRWGSPMILSFFDSVLKVKAYEIYTILITLYFVLTFPLVYVLAKLLSGKKDNYLLLLIIFFTYCLNSTLLYILYSAFFGQIIFNGLLVWITLVIFSRLLDKKEDRSFFNWPNFLLAISLSSTASIYSDGFLLVLLPLVTWAILRLFMKKSSSSLIWVVQIGLLVLITNPIPLLLAFKHNLEIFLGTLQNTAPGWEYVRFATPLDMTGFYNVYYYKKLPAVISLIFSLPVVAVCAIGFTKAKEKLFLASGLFIFIFFFIAFILRDNFFLYLRAVTYSLFIFSVIFGLGFAAIFSLFKNRLIKIIIILFVAFLSWRSADRTIRRFYWHGRAADKAIVSLKGLNSDPKINQPFFMPEIILGEGDFWQKLWMEYMLSDKKIITLGNYKEVQQFIPETKLVLSERNNNKIEYENVVWENQYYRLGEVKSPIY